MRFNLKERKPRSPFQRGLIAGIKVAIVPALVVLVGMTGVLVVSNYRSDKPPASTSMPTEQP